MQLEEQEPLNGKTETTTTGTTAVYCFITEYNTSLYYFTYHWPWGTGRTGWALKTDNRVRKNFTENLSNAIKINIYKYFAIFL